MKVSGRVKVLAYTLLIIIGLSIILPFGYITLSSFKTEDTLRSPEIWIPRNPTLEQWHHSISVLNILGAMLNSFVIATMTAVLGLLIIVPGAYVFGRKQFPGKDFLFYMVIITLLFPVLLLIIPIAETWMSIGLSDSLYGVAIAIQVFAVPWSLWTLRGYFATFPRSLEEAAMTLGCSEFQAFYKVMLPLATPAIGAVGFLLFLVGWNDFLFSNMITFSQEVKPATVVLFNFTRGSERTYWGPLMPMTLMMTIPPSVLYILAQRWIQEAFAGAGQA